MKLPQPKKPLAQAALALSLFIAATCLLALAQYSVRGTAPPSLWTNEQTSLSDFILFSGIMITFYTLMILIVVSIVKIVSARRSTKQSPTLAQSAASTVLLTSYIVCALTLAMSVANIVQAPIDAARFPSVSTPTESGN